jgi:hypothetical protein
LEVVIEASEFEAQGDLGDRLKGFSGQLTTELEVALNLVHGEAQLLADFAVAEILVKEIADACQEGLVWELGSSAHCLHSL